MKMSAEHNVEMLVVVKLNMNFYNLKTTATLYDWQRTEPKLHYLTKLHIQNAIHICTNLIGVTYKHKNYTQQSRLSKYVFNSYVRMSIIRHYSHYNKWKCRTFFNKDVKNRIKQSN